MIQVTSEKTLRSKSFASNLRDFLHENNGNYNCYRSSYKFAFVLFLPFLTNAYKAFLVQLAINKKQKYLSLPDDQFA